MENQLSDLPENVQRGLNDFIAATVGGLTTNLVSIVLYGSAAEGRLRPSSDVNIVLVLKDFEIPKVNQLREALRIAYAAIRLNVMFILESEILSAAEAFSVKFSDILCRHRVLYGTDPFTNLEVSRVATIQRLQQVILNLTFRLRERYALVSLREEQLVPIIADVTGPIRASAATILSLEGKKGMHPKESLQTFSQKLLGKDWSEILSNMSIAREGKTMKSGDAIHTMLGIIELLQAMSKYTHELR